ncbi:sporulation protein [Streptomyces sp. NRRL F-5727]|uniref:sporulation protein n=1 Tax=Streptomyces sp. NRRL F-5727 TaxID=1463871 RepID=UPI0004C51022|nr:sporulation protein [Streptomyces sp. NRRL F-5727]
MVLKRLLGGGSGGKAAGGIPLEVDTILPDEPVRPGEILRGEVVLRALDRDVRIRTVNARLVANAAHASVTKSTTADADTDTGVTLAHFQVTSLFTIPKGEERRVPLRYRLKWETPVSEVRGLPLAGTHIGLYTEVDADGIADRTDSDPVRIEATPLHETLLDAFAAAGYACRGAWVDPEYIPRTEREILYSRQGFPLAGTDADLPRSLELYLHSNAVGAEIYLRKASLTEKDWWAKPPALRYVAAHHEIGQVDFEAKARQWIDDVAALPETAVDDRERVDYHLDSPRWWRDS